MAEEGERKEEGMGLREESKVTYDKEAAVIQLLSRVQLFVSPWTEGPGRLQSTGSQRVGHD